MASIADLLDPDDRQRLEHLADPSPNPRLAEAARAAAADCAGPQRLAWLCCAIGCLDALCRDDTTADEP